MGIKSTDALPRRITAAGLPLEYLTSRVSEYRGPARSVFDEEPAYEALFDRIASGLHSGRPRHVLLVGERGVGQSVLVTEFARRAATGAFRFLADREIISVDVRYASADESAATLVSLFAEIVPHEHLVVAIDGLAALLRGDNRPRLLSALSRAQCRIIGLLTPHEHDEHFAGHADTGDFFTVVDVEEPDLPVAVKLLAHFAGALEQEYGVTIEDEAIRQAVVLSHNYILNERLPSKALRILQEECEAISFERSQYGSDRTLVTAGGVLARVAAVSGVPESTLSGIADRTDYAAGLREFIVGQDHAVREVATELGLIKAGLTDPGKPASVMMFVGQTGTGKTEMAKVLARLYSASKRLKTYTLGNFIEPHSVSGLIGVPPGYVGHDQGGRLVNELNAEPYSVFLLDEADKAHPDVMQPFLNLFDEGWIYDQRGRKAYADKAIFILTTNVGQRQIAEWCQEGKSIGEITERTKESLSQIRHTKSNRPVFTAEFLARIRRFIVFRSLDADAMTGITRILFSNMNREWSERRGKVLDVSREVEELIARQAHEANAKVSGREGGRVVRKLIADRVEAAIQQAIGVRPDEYRRASTVRVDPRLAVEFIA